MSQNVCNICGANYEYRNGRWKCPACGAFKAEELSNEEVTLLYNAAQKLRLSDFDEAEKAYTDIIEKFPKNPNGYWGRLLSRYGIKYEEDFDGRKIPTCYASIESVITDKDYLKAIELADQETRAYYTLQAQYIERVRKEWVEKAKKEKPYDIFICYKDSDLANGIDRTRDSIAAQELYIHLTEQGYRVFFSRESLRGKVGEKYEPYIFNALSTAKVMLVYGSKSEYITSTWLKNEWTRYEKRLQAGEKKPNSLIVACDGFSPNELPKVLSSMQCFDATSRSFYTDLDAVLKKIIKGEEKPKPVAEPKPEKKKSKKLPIAIASIATVVAIFLCILLPNVLGNKPSATITDSKYGVVISADSEIFDKNTSVIVDKLTDGVQYTALVSTVSNSKSVEIKNAIIYDIECDADITKNVTIKVAYSKSSADSAVKVYYVSDDKTLIEEHSCIYDDGFVQFKTNHLSYYVVGEIVPASNLGGNDNTDNDENPEDNTPAYTTIMFNANGGTGTMQNQIIPTNSSANLNKCTFTRVGYKFVGWGILGGNSIVYIDEAKYATTGQEKDTLYAVWEAIEYTATFKADGQTVATRKFTIDNKNFSLPSVPEKSGYAGMWESYTLGAEDIIINAIYTAGDYYITFKANGIEIGKVAFTVEDIKITEPSVPFKQCYSGKWESYTLDTKNITVNAVYTLSHTALIHVPATTPQCNKTGNIEYWSCSGCNKYFSDSAGTTEIINKSNVILSTVPHSYVNCVCKWCDTKNHSLTHHARVEAQCNQTGNTEYWSCSGCNKYFSNASGTSEIVDKSSVILATVDCVYIDCICKWCGGKAHELTQHARVEAQCNQTGNTEYWSCSGCNKYFSNASGTSEIVDKSSVILATVDCIYIDCICKWCGDKTHSLTHHVRVEAQCNKTGNIEYWSCSNCSKNFTDANANNVSTSFVISKVSCSYIDNICEWCGNLKTSEGLSYKLSSDGEYYTVNGIGSCNDTYLIIPSSYKNKPVKGIGDEAFYACASITRINIPDSITSIGDYAFCNCDGLTSITIPNSVTSIGESVFMYCDKLIDITIPNSINEIGKYAFNGCTSLSNVYYLGEIKSWCTISFGDNYSNPTYYAQSLYISGNLLTGDLVIPKGVTIIGNYAFYKYTKITSVTICNDVTEIGGMAFAECTGLANVTIGANVLNIGKSAFNRCTNVTTVDLGNNLKTIGDFAFASCTKLSGVIIPDSVTTIGERAFRGDTSLVSVTIGKGVTRIGDTAFYGTGLTNVMIPSSVISIGNGAFNCCPSLTNITVAGNNTVYKSEIGVLYSKDGKTLICYPAGKTDTSFVIPGSVITIGDDAFNGCSSLTSITIPTSITTIGTNAFNVVRSLTTVHYEGKPSQWVEITIMSGNDTLKNATINYGVGSEHSWDNGVITAKATYAAFAQKTYTCTICGETDTISTDERLYNDVLSGNVKWGFDTETGTLYIFGEGECKDSSPSADGASYWPWHSIRSSIKTLIIENGITSIGYHAFSYCTQLTSVSFPDTLTNIGTLSFLGCTSLVNINIPNGVTIIGNMAFEDCTSLLSVSIPNSVTEINYRAFSNCTSLTNLTFPDNLISIGYEAFYNTWFYNNSVWENGVLYIDKYLISVNPRISGECVIKEGTTLIADNAFEFCTYITSVIIPDSVKYIGGSVFTQCESLSSVTIGNGVISIDSAAFAYCYMLSSIKYRGTEEEWQSLSKGSSWDYEAGEYSETGSYTIMYNYTDE